MNFNQKSRPALHTQVSNGQWPPHILDLDGDGVKTTDLAQGIYFDHGADGFAERTGWVGAGDGLLVRDLNGNGVIDSGRELFGSETLLSSGINQGQNSPAKAANGFEALRELDSNQDGLIDASDAAWGQLRVWRDANSNAITDADELLTLQEAGVQAISVAYTDGTAMDAQGWVGNQVTINSIALRAAFTLVKCSNRLKTRSKLGKPRCIHRNFKANQPLASINAAQSATEFIVDGGVA